MRHAETAKCIDCPPDGAEVVWYTDGARAIYVSTHGDSREYTQSAQLSPEDAIRLGERLADAGRAELKRREEEAEAKRKAVEQARIEALAIKAFDTFNATPPSIYNPWTEIGDETRDGWRAAVRALLAEVTP